MIFLSSPIDTLNSQYQPAVERFKEYASVTLVYLVAAALVVYFLKSLVK